jgi:hypothetical protein
MVTAFEETLNRLGLVRREDAMTLKVAKLIVEFARRGEDNRDRLVEATVAAVRNPTEDLAGERAEHGSNAEHHHNQKRNFR